MHDKGGNPNYQPFFEQVGQMSKDAVDVGFTPTPYPDTSTYIASVRAALPTDKAPDLFTWWSTYRVKDLIDQGLVADLTPLWDKHKAEYPKGIRDAFTFNGKVYGFCDVVEYWGVWYNKAVFAKYNLQSPHHLEPVHQRLRYAEKERGHSPCADRAGALADLHHV